MPPNIKSKSISNVDAAVEIGNVIEGNESISNLHVATQPLLKKIYELRK